MDLSEDCNYLQQSESHTYGSDDVLVEWLAANDSCAGGAPILTSAIKASNHPLSKFNAHEEPTTCPHKQADGAQIADTFLEELLRTPSCSGMSMTQLKSALKSIFRVDEHKYSLGNQPEGDSSNAQQGALVVPALKKRALTSAKLSNQHSYDYFAKSRSNRWARWTEQELTLLESTLQTCPRLPNGLPDWTIVQHSLPQRTATAISLRSYKDFPQLIRQLSGPSHSAPQVSDRTRTYRSRGTLHANLANGPRRAMSAWAESEAVEFNSIVEHVEHPRDLPWEILTAHFPTRTEKALLTRYYQVKRDGPEALVGRRSPGKPSLRVAESKPAKNQEEPQLDVDYEECGTALSSRPNKVRKLQENATDTNKPNHNDPLQSKLDALSTMLLAIDSVSRQPHPHSDNSNDEKLVRLASAVRAIDAANNEVKLQLEHLARNDRRTTEYSRLLEE